MPEDQWYKLDVSAGEAVVRFLPSPQRFWPPSVLTGCPFRPPDRNVHTITITGPGAVWMYAHAAAVCTTEASGAQLVFRTPRPAEGSDSTDRCWSRLTVTGPEKAYAVVEFSLRSEPPVSQSARDQLVRARIAELRDIRPQKLLILGRASVDVYGRLAQAAVQSGVQRLACWSARDGLVVVWDDRKRELGGPMPLPQWCREALHRPALPVTIGIAGDPRLGKSILSRLLELHAAASGLHVWRLDCDGQAPTPPWYISLLGVDAEAAERLREELKRPWIPQMDEHIARQVRTARDLFDVLIADLPGGDHSGPDPRRIPTTRTPLFSQIDAFAVLTARDGRSERGWRDELSRLGLLDRLAAILTSTAPDKKPSMELAGEDDRVLRATITGLQRRRLADPASHRDLVHLRPALDRLWNALLRRARHAAIDRRV